MSTLTVDDLGAVVPLRRRPRRLVSLVPSLTESLAGTGRLVGATQWCTHPPGLQVARVRGTKNPDLGAILALAPDLVVANKEENRERDVRKLRASGIPVWVTDIESVDGALTSLGRLFTDALGLPRPQWLDQAATVWSRPVARQGHSVVVPVWRDPWMVVGAKTFTGDLLARAGYRNVFADHLQRYPRVSLAEIHRRAPELALLPDEPYPFSATDGPQSFHVPVKLVDGRLLTWYGPSLLPAWHFFAGTGSWY